MVQQYRKGKGKGKGKGKQGACRNCGESDHCCRDCANDKQDNSWTDGGIEESERQQCRQRCRQRMGRRQEHLEGSKGKGKDWYGIGKSQEWQGQNRQNDWSTPAWIGKNSTKGSSKGSVFSVDEASDSDWWTQSDGSQSCSHQKNKFTSAC